MAWRMERVSMGQVVMWNSGWRRNALVNNCACIRLESAIRTPIVLEVAADDGLIKTDLPRTQKRNDAAIVGRGSRGHKETSHKI